MSFGLFAIYLMVTVSAVSSLNNQSNLLECTIDKEQLSNILSDIESKGYKIQKQTPGMLSSAGGSNNLAPNKGGAYASILRNNVSYTNNDTFIGIEVPFTFRMGAKTAILFHGCTAPKAQYFGYKTYLWKTEENIWIWGALGNVINNNIIKTHRKFTTYVSPPFDDLTTIISTADQQTYSDIVQIYQRFGITEDMINLDHIPSDIIKMGTSSNTAFHTLYRVNIPSDIASFTEYFDNINNDNLIQIFFITKDNETDQHLPTYPLSTPAIKDRICNDSRLPSYVNGNEYYLEPKYHDLRDSFTSTMWNRYDYKVNKSNEIPGTEYDGFKCIEDNALCAGNSPDCLYYEDYNGDSFLIKAPDGVNNVLNMNIKGHRLTDNNVYVIMGVNHYALGLTAFNQETIYDEKYNAINVNGSTMNNFEYENSANFMIAFNDEYDEYNDFSEFYMIMYARPGHCVEYMVMSGMKCVEIDYDVLDENTGFIVFSRAYLNPCTDTGPSKQQFLYEYLIEFKLTKEGTVTPDPDPGYSHHDTWQVIAIVFICLFGIALCIIGGFVYKICAETEKSKGKDKHVRKISKV
eukprot:870422_1